MVRWRCKSAYASLQRLGNENIISRAPFGHTPNDKGSNMLLLLAAYMPPLRIAYEGVATPSYIPKSYPTGMLY